jgi:Icc-related predicted phosphoesterase
VTKIIHILSISDRIVEWIYSPAIQSCCPEVAFLISCGDLPYDYIEYAISHLNRPGFYVRGNHDHDIEHSSGGKTTHPNGGIDLHRRTYNIDGTLLAGIEGCIRYSPGPYQYSQVEMWQHVFSLVPRLLYNQRIYGRAMDIFVSHAPPWGIHDQPDWTHQGVKAFRWLLKVFQPAYHLHGHVHLYGVNQKQESMFERTCVINTYNYRKNVLEL